MELDYFFTFAHDTVILNDSQKKCVRSINCYPICTEMLGTKHTLMIAGVGHVERDQEWKWVITKLRKCSNFTPCGV